MFFEHAWSGKEAFGSAFEQILSVYYIQCIGVQCQTSWAVYYKGTYDKVIFLTRGCSLMKKIYTKTFTIDLFDFYNYILHAI